MNKISIPLETSATTALVYPAQGRPAGATLILAHGAGAGQQSTFMVGFAQALSARGLDVVTFNFLYIEQRRRIPDRGPVLESCFRRVVMHIYDELPSARAALFVGGKSMGGRIATQMAAEDPDVPIDGLVLLGYPLHPAGRPEPRRDKHLPSVGRPMLFVQGSRDAFGTPNELIPIVQALGPSAALRVIDGGDHSFKIGKRDPEAQLAIYLEVQHTMVTWMGAITAGKRAARTAAPLRRPGA